MAAGDEQASPGVQPLLVADGPLRTREEVDAMAALVREGVEAGALGFSSSKTLLHKDIHGEYMPGTFSGYDEMLALGLHIGDLRHLENLSDPRVLARVPARWLRRQDVADRRRVGWLVAAGLQCLLVGWLLDAAGLPVNKNLWTASFVLVAGGWSLVLLGLFHLVFDVVGAPRLGFVLSVVGANAILAYLLSAYVDYRGIAEVLCGRALETGRMSEALVPVLVLAMQWALLLFFWRRRLFLRV